MVERKGQEAARCDQASRGSQRVMHGSGMVQDSPRINHVESTKAADIVVIKDRALLDRPVTVAGKIAFAQLCGTSHGIFIKVERMHARTELARRKRKQPTPRTNIQKALPGEGIALKQPPKRPFRFGQLIGTESASKIQPIVAKSETTVLNFSIRHS